MIRRDVTGRLFVGHCYAPGSDSGPRADLNPEARRERKLRRESAGRGPRKRCVEFVRVPVFLSAAVLLGLPHSLSTPRILKLYVYS